MKSTHNKSTCAHENVSHVSDLQKIGLFQGAEPAFLDRLAEASSPHHFSKGHVVFMQDDLAEWFYVVRSGWVKLSRQILDGDEVILDVLPGGTLFGETDLFDNRAYTCTAEVVQDAHITAYPISILRHEVVENQNFAMRMLKHAVHGQRERDKEIEHRTVQNAPQRLGCFLLKLIPSKKQGAITLHLPYDKTLVASRLGMQSETFSRALGRLKEDIGLKVKGATVEIRSMDELISYTCSACSNAYPCGE